MDAPYIPGAYLVGGSIQHFLSLLLQTSVSVKMTWICNQDLALLPPPTVEIAKPKPKLTLQVNRLNAKPVSKTAVEEEKGEDNVIAEEDKGKCAKFFYEVKYPELLAAMMQTKVVSLTKKEGFEFIDYYYSRGNKKQN